MPIFLRTIFSLSPTDDTTATNDQLTTRPTINLRRSIQADNAQACDRLCTTLSPEHRHALRENVLRIAAAPVKCFSSTPDRQEYRQTIFRQAENLRREKCFHQAQVSRCLVGST